MEGTTEANVSLLGRSATIVVPTGRDNVTDLLELFLKLEQSLAEIIYALPCFRLFMNFAIVENPDIKFVSMSAAEHDCLH